MVRRFRFLLLTLVLLLAIYLSRDAWLSWMGRALILDEGPAKADMAVVLAGDGYGHRIEKAAQLARAGYVPSILIDGPPGSYGYHECDLAIPYITREGYPSEWFIPLPMPALSTREEAGFVLAEMKRRHVRSFLLVTSNYHSGRAARVFRTALRRESDPPAMRVVASSDEFFEPNSWWRTRQGRKTGFMEFSKVIAEAVGL